MLPEPGRPCRDRVNGVFSPGGGGSSHWADVGSCGDPFRSYRSFISWGVRRAGLAGLSFRFLAYKQTMLWIGFVH
jgi:hypothetical protein